MRLTHPMHYVSAAAALVLLAGCASSSVGPPKPSTPVRSAHSAVGYHGISYNACPAKGALAYVSDENDGTVNIFAGTFHGQAPCGILTGISLPQGMIVRSGDLYVAKGAPFPQVRAFHRGATTPFMNYFNPACGDEPIDVTVSDDGYVLATNVLSLHCAMGSISVWKKSTGALIADYPSASGLPLSSLTIQKDGTVYYDDGTPSLWVGKCVRGVCGSFSNTGAVLVFAGGIRSVDDEHVVLNDQDGTGSGRALTYIPPAFNTPSGSCSLGSGDPVDIDINFKESRLFVTDAKAGVAKEYKYPAGGGDGHACVLIGSVSTSGGSPIGIAVDRPESL